MESTSQMSQSTPKKENNIGDQSSVAQTATGQTAGSSDAADPVQPTQSLPPDSEHATSNSVGVPAGTESGSATLGITAPPNFPAQTSPPAKPLSKWYIRYPVHLYQFIAAQLNKIRPIVAVFGLILLIVVGFLWKNIFISIKPGEGGVLYKRLTVGTITDYVYPEGFYLIWPWDIMYVYNARIQLLRHEFDVLTNKGLPIHLRLAIRFQPEYDLLGVLHQQVGQDYAEKVIIPQIESVLRKNIGQHDPEDVYTNKMGILSKIIVLALEEAGRKYVRVDDIIIRSMELPPPIQQAIEDKLTYQQQYQAYSFRIAREEEEAKRKRIEAKGVADYHEIISQNLTTNLLRWQGISATAELAQSENAKVVVIGAGDEGLPLILGNMK